MPAIARYREIELFKAEAKLGAHKGRTYALDPHGSGPTARTVLPRLD